MKKHLIIFLVLVISISGISQTFAQDKQDKQKNLMGSYIGRWRGNVTGKNINRLGGWDDKFLGYHEILKEESNFYLDVRFLHLLDDPSTIEQYKKLGYPPETIELYRNMMAVPDELTINGYAILSGISEYTHITREYCEECAGKDGTTRKDFPAVVFPVSGEIDLVENKIEFDFSDMPEEYDEITCLLGESKLVAPDKIEFNFKNFEEPNDGVYALEQIAKGELYRIYVKKDTLGKTIQINEPIKTDEFTQREIVVPAVPEMPDFPYKIGEIIVAGNTECVFTSENELHLISGEVISFVDKNWWKNVDLDKVVSSEPEISDIELGELTNKLTEKVKELREEGYSFKVRPPQAVIGVRGTQFITKVEEDGTTILTVLDGEVEFSGISKKKAVLVKKNQKSVVKPGGLPFDPVSIDHNQIPRWWE